MEKGTKKTEKQNKRTKPVSRRLTFCFCSYVVSELSCNVYFDELLDSMTTMTGRGKQQTTTTTTVVAVQLCNRLASQRPPMFQRTETSQAQNDRSIFDIFANFSIQLLCAAAPAPSINRDNRTATRQLLNLNSPLNFAIKATSIAGTNSLRPTNHRRHHFPDSISITVTISIRIFNAIQRKRKSVSEPTKSVPGFSPFPENG